MLQRALKTGAELEFLYRLNISESEMLIACIRLRVEG